MKLHNCCPPWKQSFRSKWIILLFFNSKTRAFFNQRRRFVWNFFRLENEHLNNCGEFRAVRDISIAPLHTDDLTTLESMIDKPDGADVVLLKRKVAPLDALPAGRKIAEQAR